MTIITLTTDWANDDFYVAAIKGLIYSKCSDVRVIDVTHRIDTYKYTQAAFVLKNSFTHFPSGSIHIVGINSDITELQPPICLKMNDQYFIGAANGLFSLMFTEQPQLIVEIKESGNIKKSSFPELTLFAETATFLALGGDIKSLGPEMPGNYRHVQFMPAYDENAITGSVLYIDSYQNIITNISSDLFYQVGKNRKYSITVKSENYTVNKLCQNYSEVEIGELLALFNSLDLLELAIRNGKLAELIDVKINSPVTIKFR